MTPEALMRRALELAERGRGLTSPNPLVGAVVAHNGEIVGEGFHERAGGPHAEIVALEAAGARARGATLYVTLEPCNHAGRTPPCVPAIFAAGITRVVAAAADPNPFVPGGGAAALRDKGVAVVTGVLEAEAAGQNRVFFTAMRERRPHVTLKAGMTADGKIADVHGAARWMPARALIAVGETAPAARVAALQSAGAAVVRFPVRDGRVAVDAVLAALFEREVCAVLVEGGGEVHASFLEAGVVDRVTLFVAPLLLGGRTAPTLVGGAGRDLKSAIRLGQLTARAVGDDLLIEADVVRPDSA